MKAKPCRLTFNGQRYQINQDGSVYLIVSDPYATVQAPAPESADIAKAVRAEASRLRRNRHARVRSQVMREMGLVKTPYGWE